MFILLTRELQNAHAIDFAEQHFQGKDGLATDFFATETLQSKTSWNVIFSLMPKPEAANRPNWARKHRRTLCGRGSTTPAKPRKARSGTRWRAGKWAGMLEARVANPPPGATRFPATGWGSPHPVFDLSNVRTAYALKQGLDRRPDDGNSLLSLE